MTNSSVRSRPRLSIARRRPWAWPRLFAGMGRIGADPSATRPRLPARAARRTGPHTPQSSVLALAGGGLRAPGAAFAAVFGVTSRWERRPRRASRRRHSRTARAQPSPPAWTRQPWRPRASRRQAWPRRASSRRPSEPRASPPRASARRPSEPRAWQRLRRRLRRSGLRSRRLRGAGLAAAGFGAAGFGAAGFFAAVFGAAGFAAAGFGAAGFGAAGFFAAAFGAAGFAAARLRRGRLRRRRVLRRAASAAAAFGAAGFAAATGFGAAGFFAAAFGAGRLGRRRLRGHRLRGRRVLRRRLGLRLRGGRRLGRSAGLGFAFAAAGFFAAVVPVGRLGRGRGGAIGGLGRLGLRARGPALAVAPRPDGFTFAAALAFGLRFVVADFGAAGAPGFGAPTASGEGWSRGRNGGVGLVAAQAAGDVGTGADGLAAEICSGVDQLLR